MKEIWKDVSGYEGLYQVSNFGRVKSLERRAYRRYTDRASNWIRVPERILKPMALPSSRGGSYQIVRLHKDGIYRDHPVHRLVLETFVGPCPEGMEACHFPKRDPGNNRLDNLRWDTRKNNSEDRKFHGTRNGWKLSAEVRMQMSIDRKGKKRNPEAVEKSAAWHRGRKRSDESRARMKEARKKIRERKQMLLEKR